MGYDAKKTEHAGPKPGKRGFRAYPIANVAFRAG
jgi:hypothetical protein